ncbi:MAG: hypothetical protein IPL27_18350 [Lewinellaceae bacterium]|nr:hypothetical protein [Lewinellaceae bacterium]
MKKHICYFSCLCALTLLASACKDKAEAIPAYLQLEPFAVNAQGGAAGQKITDGWLYVNGEFLGAYTLPATVPILADGESEVWVFPGVKKNGLVETPDIYSMMKRDDRDYNLTPGQTTVIQPITDYDANTVYAWDLNRGSFDGGTVLLLEARDDDPVTNFALTSDGAFGGVGRSVSMKVDTAHALIEIAVEQVPLPTAGAQETWLEIHYRNDVPFELWLLGTRGLSTQELSQAVYYFNTSDNWNKTYFNLTEFVVAMQQDKYRLFFRVALPKDAAGKYTQTEGTVRLDNIRLLHF